ncbi:hypothetical protein C6568_16015 [Melaminivora suipulveris]|uniref:Flagellar hook-length control protein-like C-terminal domain-containing protein n=1 Tax=Melaminivora suipulveris TaxID=2109913 RepID=A0A2R3QFL8_9BURK|nr:flagellar hook-length control protein FliK [Melaminivora suipulveris]AVO50571.1 hypothetical protein C6568_16015 [Melaminivora suipulveris]
MNTDRPIHLDLDMPGASTFGQPAGAGAQAAPQDGRDAQQLEGEAQRLRALLDGNRSAPPPAAAPGLAQPAGPFALFASPALPGAPADPAPAAAGLPPDIDRQLATMARRLLVADGSGGQRAVQIELDTEHFPGVVLQVSEEGGRLQATFTCSREDSRERLAASCQWLAESLAERLGRAASVCVQTDDPEDRSPVQASAG